MQERTAFNSHSSTHHMAHNKHSRVIFSDGAFQSVVFNRAAELSFIPQQVQLNHTSTTQPWGLVCASLVCVCVPNAQWMCLLRGHCGAVPDGSLAPVCCLDFRSLEDVQSSVVRKLPVQLSICWSRHRPARKRWWGLMLGGIFLTSLGLCERKWVITSPTHH